MLETIDPQWNRDLILRPVSSQETAAPRLSLERIGSFRQFFSNLAALLRGPMAPRLFLGDPFFRDCWIERKFPKTAFAAAIVVQALLIRFPPPIWNLPSAQRASAFQQMELTWYGPVNDFPLIAPAPRTPKVAAARNAAEPVPTPPADAFHPRQTILSEPLRPNHPRQTLIQPKAPQEPPKILPALPNIVQFDAAQPVRPKTQLAASELTALRPKTPKSLTAENVAVPDITTLEKQPGAINIAASSQVEPKPLLPVNPMSSPHATRKGNSVNTAAPEVGGRVGASETLIALSATPAPVAPPPVMPSGNLAARVSISPEEQKSGTTGAAGSETVGQDARRGPDGIFISGGSGANASQVSGVGIIGIPRAGGNPLPAGAVARPRDASEGPRSLASDADLAAVAKPKLGMVPHEVLRGKRVYTLYVNMPNMTSASGSWILNFAEMRNSQADEIAKSDAGDLASPVPLRKVDPKYPPELRSGHVDGEVVLYAIIRKDGSVDSIELVKSIDPVLDTNAMEALAQWKFRAAEKRGEPVDLEAVVHIPFRSRAPVF